MQVCQGVNARQSRGQQDLPPLIAEIVADLLDTASLEVQDTASVRDAIVRFRKGDVDLHDCLIRSLAAQRGAKTVTFDTKASKRLGMELLR